MSHGYAAYRRGCRCDVCRRANTTVKRQQREHRRTAAAVPVGRLAKAEPPALPEPFAGFYAAVFGGRHR